MCPSVRAALIAASAVLSAAAAFAQATTLPVLNLRFEQAVQPDTFVAQGIGYRAAISSSGYSMFLRHAGTARTVSVSLIDADPHAAGRGIHPLPTKTTYLRGSDPAKWRKAVPSFAEVRYGHVLPGIDLLYHSRTGNMEFDFIVEGGADPSHIALRFRGQDELHLDSAGNLVVSAGGMTFVQKAPTVYQRNGESLTLIAGEYQFRRNGDVGFQLGAYDPERPLIIDPVVVYSGFLSGNGTDKAISIARDAKGILYVAGNTGSTTLTASENAIQASRSGDQDLFVMKINPSLPPDQQIQYLTYIGGTGADELTAMALDDSGHVYLTGNTSSTDLPTSSGAQQATAPGAGDAFVIKLDFSEAASSGVVYTTYLGGAGLDGAYAIAADAEGSAYIAGFTGSSDFPVTGAAVQTASAGGWDGFVTRLDPSGVRAYSTYLGGDRTDSARAIAVAPDGTVIVALNTISGSITTAGQSYSTTYWSGGDIFIARLSLTDSSILYGSYLGGSGLDSVARIALDKNGRLVLTGSTLSTDFPITAQAIQGQNAGGTDVFLSVIDFTKAGAAGLIYSTYLGGKAIDSPAALYVDRNNQAVIAGYTTSTDFPTTLSSLQRQSAGLADAFVTKLDLNLPVSGVMTYSSYLGGAQNDFAYGVLADDNGSIYVVGTTSSRRFPITADDRGSYPGDFDAFVLILQPCAFSLSPSSRQIGSEGGINTFLVSTSQECTWSAQSSADWIAIQSGSSGRGNGEVSISVQPNGLTASRTGTVLAADQTFTLTQSGVDCKATLSSSSVTLGKEQATFDVPVSLNADDCAWSSSSSQPWISVVAGATGKGNGLVTFAVEANTGAASREAVVLAAGRELRVVQYGTASNVIRPDAVELRLTAPGGSTAAVTGTVNLNSLGAPLDFTIQITEEGNGWLTATPQAGRTPAQITITAKTAGLLPAVYYADVRILSNGEPEKEQRVTVYLTITPP